jgi:hypothetical protein
MAEAGVFAADHWALRMSFRWEVHPALGGEHLQFRWTLAAVRDLPGPRRPEAGRCQQGCCESIFEIIWNTPGKLDRTVIPETNVLDGVLISCNHLGLRHESAERSGPLPFARRRYRSRAELRLTGARGVSSGPLLGHSRPPGTVPRSSDR